MPDDRRWYRPHPDLWTYRVPMRILGMDAGRRGCVARYADDRWAFIGPVPLDDGARRELDEAGRVDVLIVPTAFHNAFVPEACAAFPEADVYLARSAKTVGLPAERIRSLPDELPHDVKKGLRTFPFEGMRTAHEVAFVHRASASLIVADLCMHYPGPAANAWTRILRKLFGWTPGCRIPTLMKVALRDRDAARTTLESIRRMTPRRILMSHGVPVEEDVDAVLGDLNRQLR
jgi:hypothetical protein